MFDPWKTKLIDRIGDDSIVKLLYLDIPIGKLIRKLHSIKLNLSDDLNLVPFNAQIRGYTGAIDQEGNPWLLKEVSDDDIFSTKVQEIAFYIDHCLNTPAAPTFLYAAGKKFYRATKTIQNAMQIGSYNYLEKPYIIVLANDLINRWLFFDEDRNPNNYLILHNKKGDPFVVAIDYDKADLLTTGMKIEGNSKKFGWNRKGKNRFLTLLKPENFESLSLSDFESRLDNLLSIEEHTFYEICMKTLRYHVPGSVSLATDITQNLIERRAYIDQYFRNSFSNKKKVDEESPYGGLGKSFLAMYQKK